MSRQEFCAILLGTAFVAPAMLCADDKHEHEHEHENKRYYDRERKDWHEWNEREERAYHQYLNENHREYHDWAKANRKEQEEYWHWRHEHPDAARR